MLARLGQGQCRGPGDPRRGRGPRVRGHTRGLFSSLRVRQKYNSLRYCLCRVGTPTCPRRVSGENPPEAVSLTVAPRKIRCRGVPVPCRLGVSRCRRVRSRVGVRRIRIGVCRCRAGVCVCHVDVCRCRVRAEKSVSECSGAVRGGKSPCGRAPGPCRRARMSC